MGLTKGSGRSTPGDTESSSTRLRMLFLLGIGGEELGPGAAAVVAAAADKLFEVE